MENRYQRKFLVQEKLLVWVCDRCAKYLRNPMVYKKLC